MTQMPIVSTPSPLLWINGAPEKGQGSFFQNVNPSTGQSGFGFNQATDESIERAFQGAKKAQPQWESLGFEKRWAILENWKKNLLEKREKLLQILLQETGKALWDGEGELQAFFNKWSLTHQAHQELLAGKIEEKESWHYRSMGVFVVLGPFNFPLHLPGGQILPALATGGAVVYKPSELTSAVAELYVESAYEAGLPAGVLQLVLGKGDVGQALVKHPLTDAVLFTGSQKVGTHIYKELARTPHKLVALEMGGCNALVVSDLQDIEAAASQIALSAFATSGQRCSCARRVFFIKNKSSQKVFDAFVKIAERLSVGAYFDKQQSFMGPLIRDAGVDEVLAFEQKLLAKGGRSLLKASRLNRSGNWISPSIVEMKKSSLISDEECFGPVVQVTWTDNLEEAIDLANATTMGLSASLLSDSEAEFIHFRSKIEAGVINWNEPTVGASSKLPFGGIKGSGNHRPSGYTMIESCVWPVASKTSRQLKAANLPGLPS